MAFYVISLSPHRHAHHEQTNETTAQAKPTDEENDQISPEASDQSAIERAVRDITTSGRKREREKGRNIPQSLKPKLLLTLIFNLVNWC